MIYESTYYNPNYLAHFGVKGMRWGVRRYEKKYGSQATNTRTKLGKAIQNFKDADQKGESKGILKGKYKDVKKAVNYTQGKELYAQGHRLSKPSISSVGAALSYFASGFLVQDMIRNGKNSVNSRIADSINKVTWDKGLRGGKTRIAITDKTVLAGELAVTAAFNAAANSRQRKLSAYAYG